MKTILQTIAIILSLSALYSCQDITVGYLKTDNASYQPDSLLVKAVLDTDEDKERIANQIPWQSSTIDGVQGTAPISYSIKAIHTVDGDIQEATKQIKMQGRGIITIPCDHTIPPGRYIIDVRIQNEGYTVDKNSIFTVIITQ